MAAAARSWDSSAKALIGSAKVPIRNLRPERSRKRLGYEDLNLKNVDRLIWSFALDKCRPFENGNRVPVVLSDTVLRRVLAQNHLNIAELQNVPPPTLHLDDDTLLTYLHGRHRLAAAEQFLHPNEQWWGVDLYRSHDLPGNARRDLREHGDNSQKDCDGFIFSKIRHYQDQDDEEQVARWLTKWSGNPSKVRDFHQLQTSETARGLKLALDKNLCYGGLWKDFKMGTFHRILSMRCHEESACYLVHNADIWHSIANELAQHVDAHTVRCLQGRSPFYSTTDRQFVLDSFKNGELFSSIIDPRVRFQLQERVCSVKCVIPSLYCFQENTMILEPPSKIIRQLLPRKFRGTIREGLFKRYVHPQNGQVSIQRDEDRFYLEECSSHQFGFWAAYREIWLFAIRHYPDMTAIKPRKDKKPATRHGARNTAECWSRLGLLAARVGFQSKEIRTLLRADRDLAVAKDALACARPTETYTAELRELENRIQGVKVAIQHFKPVTVDNRFASLTHNGAESWRLKARCGRTYEQAFYDDQCLCFLKQIYGQRRRVSPRSNVTSFAVARDIFHAFFGASFEEDNTFSDFEGAAVGDSRSVTPDEAAQSESELDEAEEASPMLISTPPVEPPQFETQLDNARQESPTLAFLSSTHPSPLEAQLDNARQNLSTPMPLSRIESLQSEVHTDVRQLGLAVGESNRHESPNPQSIEDPVSSEDDEPMSGCSPHEPSPGAGLAILGGERLSGPVLDDFVPAFRNSVATVFPGQVFARGNGAPILPAIAITSNELAIAPPSMEPAFTLSTIPTNKAALNPPQSPGSTRFGPSNRSSQSKPPNLDLLTPTAFESATPKLAERFSPSPQSEYSTIIQPLARPSEAIATVDATTALVSDVDQSPTVLPRNTVFPGKPVLANSLASLPAAALFPALPPASILVSKLPIPDPIGSFTDQRHSISNNQVAISYGTLESGEQPHSEELHCLPRRSEISQPQNFATKEDLVGLATTSMNSVIPDLDVPILDAPTSAFTEELDATSAQQRNTTFPGHFLTAPCLNDIEMASVEQTLQVAAKPALSKSRIRPAQRPSPAPQMSRRDAQQRNEPKRVLKRARGTHSVAEKIAMYESKPPEPRSTLMPGPLNPAVTGWTPVSRLRTGDGNDRPFSAGTKTADLPMGSPPTEAQIHLSNDDGSLEQKIPQHYTIVISRNGSSKVRVLEGSPGPVDRQRKDQRELAKKRESNRKVALRQSYIAALRQKFEVRTTMFPSDLILPPSREFRPSLRPDPAIQKIQASFAEEIGVGPVLQREAGVEQAFDGLVHVPTRITLMPGLKENHGRVVETRSMGSATFQGIAAEDSTNNDILRHFQDEQSLLEGELEGSEHEMNRSESEAEEINTLRQHFDFQSSPREENFVSVKYHVPAGILIKSYMEYQDLTGGRMASVIIILTDHGFDCKFYNKTKAGLSALYQDLVHFSSESACYFTAHLETRRYWPQKDHDMIKTSLKYGLPLIVHFNRSSFRNEIDFGQHDSQGISILGDLAIPHWDSHLGRWEIYYPD